MASASNISESTDSALGATEPYASSSSSDSERAVSLRKRVVVFVPATGRASYSCMPPNVAVPEVDVPIHSEPDSANEVASESSPVEIKDLSQEVPLKGRDLERVIAEIARTSDLCDPILWRKTGVVMVVAALFVFTSNFIIVSLVKQSWPVGVAEAPMVIELLFVILGVCLALFGKVGEDKIHDFILGRVKEEEVTKWLYFRNPFTHLRNTLLEILVRCCRTPEVRPSLGIEQDPNGPIVPSEPEPVGHDRLERKKEERKSRQTTFRRTVDEMRSLYKLFNCPICSQRSSSGNGSKSDVTPSVQPMNVPAPAAERTSSSADGVVFLV